MRYWCQIQVLKNGRRDWPYEYAKVSGEVHGFLGGYTQEVRTDSRGIATLEWSSDERLDKIFVSGKTYHMTVESGESIILNYPV